MSRTRALLCRLDNLGDVLLTGPAVRAVARSADVAMLCGPSGTPAARMLPGVSEVLCFDAPWVGYRPPPVDADVLRHLAAAVRRFAPDVALIFTSSHQSPLPLALVLRLAGVPWIGATSVDHPGSLLDLRRRPDPDLHEVEQALALAAEAGFSLDDSDEGELRLRDPLPAAPALPEGYVVVHPGASVEARAVPTALASAAIDVLEQRDVPVVLTGTASEAPATRLLARHRRRAVDLAGRLDVATLASVLAGADAVVAGNTGPAHLAAAVGTPVVSLFAPVVPAHRWRPWRVPHVLLGAQEIGCAGCRSRRCPHPQQWCISAVTGHHVAGAVEQVRRSSRASATRAGASA